MPGKRWKSTIKTSRNQHTFLFDSGPRKVQAFSLVMEDILFDFSKNQLTEETLQLLISLANECQLPAAIEAMFNGEK